MNGTVCSFELLGESLMPMMKVVRDGTIGSGLVMLEVSRARARVMVVVERWWWRKRMNEHQPVMGLMSV